jgi:hypothetical protein
MTIFYTLSWGKLGHLYFIYRYVDVYRYTLSWGKLGLSDIQIDVMYTLSWGKLGLSDIQIDVMHTLSWGKLGYSDRSNVHPQLG